MRIILITMLIGMSLCRPNDTANFENKLDEIDFKETVKNEALMTTIFDCLLDRKPCGEFQFLKDVIPELIETKCNKCSTKMKTKFDETHEFLLKTYPKIYKEVLDKYSKAK